jgi:hypothetical protein
LSFPQEGLSANLTDTNNILRDCGLSSSSESSDENEKEKEMDINEKEREMEKPFFGVLAGHTHFALSKIQDFLKITTLT